MNAPSRERRPKKDVSIKANKLKPIDATHYQDDPTPSIQSSHRIIAHIDPSEPSLNQRRSIGLDLSRSSVSRL